MRIVAGSNADSVVIAVEDTGAGLRSGNARRGSGIGLANVRERLMHVYGDAAILRLEDMSGGGTRVVLTLPQRPEVQA